LWDKDPRLAKPLLEGFYAMHDLIVGDNEPYKGSLRNDCMYQHGTMRGLAHAIIEYRQDLVRDEAGQQAWADRTVAIMSSLLACDVRGPALRRVEQHGSLSDAPRRANIFAIERSKERSP
jgi:predicted N-formylglutamate amidohydrolase